MKRGSSSKVVAISLVLIISLSFVSAGIFEDLAKVFFPGFAPTGNVIGEGTSCVDYDVSNSPSTTASSAALDGVPYDDYCVGDIAYDRFCVWNEYNTNTGIKAGLALLKPTITGKVTGGVDDDPEEGSPGSAGAWSLDKSAFDCSSIGKACADGGCGCEEGSTVECGDAITIGNVGICKVGTQTCSNDAWGSCIGAQGPETEVCNGLNDDCDDQTDENTCEEGFVCRQEVGFYDCYVDLGGCTDEDGDGYGNPGSAQCSKGSETDCDDTDPDVHPGAMEICGGGLNPFGPAVDNNCNGIEDTQDDLAHAWCNLDGGNNKICANSGGDNVVACVTYECDDGDQDGYGREGTNTIPCANPENDCNDGNANVNPGIEESFDAGNCNDGVDNDCDGKTDNDDSSCSGIVLPSCTDNDGDFFSVETDLSSCAYSTCGPNECVNSFLTNSQGNTNDQINFNPTSDKTPSGTSYIADDNEIVYLAESDTKIKGGNDCDDSDPERSPELKEICDLKDNDCNDEVDDIETAFMACAPKDNTNGGQCLEIQIVCHDQFEREMTCEELNYAEPLSAELNQCNGIDDDCLGGIDDDVICGCSQGDNRSCEVDQNPCTIGTQTCSQSAWGACIEVQDPECDEDDPNICVPGDVKVCGSNIGMCNKGGKECQDNGVWGACDDDEPIREICGNGLDEDCDGIEDEPDCIVVAGSSSGSSSSSSSSSSSGSSSSSSSSSSSGSSSSSSSSGGSGEEDIFGTKDSQGFFSRLFRFFLGLFRVASTLSGHSISEAPTVTVNCIDSDGGKNYFLMGAGQGLSATGNEAVFGDFCYKGSQSNRVDRCGGDGCFLLEYYCDGDKITSDRSVICEYGCLEGGCIPDLSLSEDCNRFNKNTWQWENNC